MRRIVPYFFIVLGSLLTLSCHLFERPFYIKSLEANAVWSEFDTEIAIIGSFYETQQPSVPYYGDATARNWINVVYITDSNLQNKSEVYRWNDELGNASQGSIQTRAVYYRKTTNSIYYSLLTNGVVRNIASGQVYMLALPKNSIREIFTYNGAPVYEADGLVPVIETIPSPDGAYVAVVHQAAILTGSFDLVYLTAIGVFTSTGSYRGVVPLSEWNDTDVYLKVFHYAPFPDLNPPSPAFQTYRSVPTHAETLVVWDPHDNTVFYVLNTSHSSNNKAPAIKVQIVQNSISVETLLSLPAITFTRPTSGGPFSTQGALLMVKAYPDDPNKFTIIKYTP